MTTFLVFTLLMQEKSLENLEAITSNKNAVKYNLTALMILIYVYI
ncbi:protein of unknown function [Tenacibaculum sp. 190524A02b]|uniref:Uncharacterized protein n=1 Tax=Tenacibaculum vairaonense TaxID=3137860 RepID=A0ABP1F9H2_9FLAO